MSEEFCEGFFGFMIRLSFDSNFKDHAPKAPFSPPSLALFVSPRPLSNPLGTALDASVMFDTISLQVIWHTAGARMAILFLSEHALSRVPCSGRDADT
jgi:hypothetical protein